MKLRYARRFVAALRLLPPAEKRAVLQTLEWFVENPTAVELSNHPLQGAMAGKRAIAVDGDLRIVFTERDAYAEVTLLDVGGHLTVYRL